VVAVAVARAQAALAAMLRALQRVQEQLQVEARDLRVYRLLTLLLRLSQVVVVVVLEPAIRPLETVVLVRLDR
jgi:hypothetical protein